MKAPPSASTPSARSMVRREFTYVIRTLALVLAALWITELVDEYVFHQALNQYGVHPQNPSSLPGILAAPFLHGNFAHLSSNTGGLLVLGSIVLVWSRREFWKVFLASTVVGGLGTWLVSAPNSVHIGASGVIFGLFGYLLLRGWFERKFAAIAVSLVVAWFFGSMAAGMFPQLAGAGISWEMHAFGFLGGALVAWTWRRRSKKPSRRS